MTPPRLARWLLDRALPRGPEGDTIRGDLVEQFAARAATSPRRAAAWYWRAMLSVLLRYRMPRRAAGPEPQRQSVLIAIVQDTRYAARTLLKAPAFTAVVVATLTLGIGANTAIFSALNAVLLTPLPYPHADRLVRLVAFNPLQGIESSNVSAADFVDWERDAKAFEQLAAYAAFSTSMRGVGPDAPAERVPGALIYHLFEVLGVPPALGREFTPQDIRPGPAATAVVSDGFWRRRFGADPVAVGRPLRQGSPTALVGVMPRGFAYPAGTELWIPTRPDAASDSRDNRYYEALARLRRGVSAEQAQAELDAISARLDAAYPKTNRGWRVRAVPLGHYVIGEARRTLLLLFAAVGLVLLIACANVASLFLANASGRRRELAVRAAIGAGRGRIVRQVLTESVLLSTIAGALGILVGRWALQLLIAIGAGGIPRLEGATLDSTVLAFSVAVSVVTGLLFGTVPALQLSRANLVDALREGARGGVRGRTRQILVVVEVALALVLLVAAGLVGRSFRALRQLDVGFRPDHLLTLRVTLTGPRYRQQEPGVRYFDEARRRIAALPGVVSAAAVLWLPVGGGGFDLGRGFILPGRPHPPEGYNAGFQIVTPGYFRTVGMPLLKGRDFDDRDSAASPPVVIVGRRVAERLFAGENPIGQRLLVTPGEQTPREIVGVCSDAKSKGLTAEEGPTIYVPHTQSWLADLTLVVHTEGPPAASSAAVKGVLQAIDPTQAAYDVRTFDAIMADALAQHRFSATIFTAFAGLALGLAAVGLYGVMTHLVNGRRHEMGVRLALGARPSEVRMLLVRQAMWLLALGLGAGLPAALIGARLLGKLLYGVSSRDPATLAVVVATLSIATFVSSYLPVRRATRVDPARVLRSD